MWKRLVLLKKKVKIWYILKLPFHSNYNLPLCFFVFFKSDTTDRITIPLFMLCISIAWSPKMFKWQSSPTKYTEGEEDNLAPVDNIRIKSSRSRITLICSVLKIPLIFVVSFVVCWLLHVADNENPFHAFKIGTKSFMAHKDLYSMFCIQVVSSFLGYIMCWLACTMNLQKVCFVIPLMLATPISLGISVSQVCDFFALVPCHNYKGEDYQTIILGLALWLSQLLSYSFQFFKAQTFLMAGEELLFWLPTYDGNLSLLSLFSI